VLLDLDDTIIRESDYFLCIFSQFAEQKKIQLKKVERFMLDFEYFRRNQKDIFTFFLTQLEINSTENHMKLFTLYKEIDCGIHPLPGVAKLIEFCKNKKITIVCLTNGVVAAQKNKWRNLKLNSKDYMQLEVAADYNLQKPDTNLYKMLENKYSIDWKRLITIGDKFENDLSVPFSLGSYAIIIDQKLEINKLNTGSYKVMKVSSFIEAYYKFVSVHDRV